MHEIFCTRRYHEMKKKLLTIIFLLGAMLLLTGCGGKKVNGTCDACNKERYVKAYKITIPYDEIRYMYLCESCSNAYSISVPLLLGTIEELQEDTFSTNITEQPSPTPTLIPENYTLAPGSTIPPSIAKYDPSGYDRLIKQLENSIQEDTIQLSHINPNTDGLDITDRTGYPLENRYIITMTRKDSLANGMLLINQSYPLPVDFDSTGLKNISAFTGSSLKAQVIDDTISLFPNAIDAIQEAITAAESEGINGYLITAGYRSDGSEFNSGLSFIMQTNDGTEYDYSQQGRWMNENSWKYGLIYNQNIYRYVGKGNAAVMHYFDIDMESYIKYLQAHPHIAIYEDGILKYEILRQYVGDADSFYVELTGNAKSDTTSFDNTGSIITVFEY